MEDFWADYEEVISSYKELIDAIDLVFNKWKSKKKIFAWRGHSDSSWPLHSSLHRRLIWTNPTKDIKEDDVYDFEGKILADLHRWGLHTLDGKRLPILSQLAILQHYGAPTRLIDISFNPWIAVWFAVEEKWNNGKIIEDEVDARLFAFDITNRLINEKDSLRSWEDGLKRPWSGFPEWCSSAFAWKPPNIDARIAAQNSGFIFGGIPKSIGKMWPKATGGHWSIKEVRKSTSIAIRPHKLKTSAGGVSENAVYTFRIRKEAKKEILEHLERNFSYIHSVIYPDYIGFSLAGFHKRLKSVPR